MYTRSHIQECLLQHCCDNKKQANCLVITESKQWYIHKMEQYDVIKMINIYINAYITNSNKSNLGNIKLHRQGK